ncbi:uncharacterized protein J8A68_005737 [[Candida] subhashii]|uniref:Rho1 guanine nucleotide exchange factor TUS1 n=1 Tax=[Candida] subhashii TaxID=561895 RepID=A0A8J5QLK4_9ASCO|nr:uncharacterized protein J8A68_005737 [[Candida] subhashii]KAG7660775.1 hypothetical protein J8A68_005737 [[Candida] subhashii]
MDTTPFPIEDPISPQIPKVTTTFTSFENDQYIPTTPPRPKVKPHDFHTFEIRSSPPRPFPSEQFIDNTYDDSFSSVDSPKPKGPREIWEYDPIAATPVNYSDPNKERTPITIDRVKSKQRGYQELSRSKSTPSVKPPYPIEETPPYPIEERPPYPIEENIDELLDPNDFEFGVDTSTQGRTNRIIHESLNDASPRINEVPSLPSRQSLSIAPVTGYSRSSSVSPSRHGTGTSRMSFSISDPSYITPPATDVYSHSPLQDNSYSRSPSPRRGHFGGRSPSLQDYSLMIDNFDEGYNEFNLSEGPSSRWNSVHSRESYFAVTDNPFIDEDEEFHEFESPISEEDFDYSILPDLPSPKGSVVTTLPIPTLSINRKHEELPPLPLDLPQLPFNASTLLSQHFQTCQKVWSVSEIFQWCLRLQIWSHDSFISKRELKKALVRLMAFHRSDTTLDIITSNASVVINNFIETGAVVVDENEKTIGDKAGITLDSRVYVSGVLPNLTRCYFNFRHRKTGDLPLTCYSSSCNVNRIMNYEAKMKNTNIKEIVLGRDWSTHWHLTAEDLSQIEQGLKKHQSYVFDLLRYEQTFLQRARCLVEVVAPKFIKAVKDFSNSDPNTITKLQDGLIDAGNKIIQFDQEHVFEPLLRILIAEGKFIKSIAEICNIFHDWAIEIKQYLLRYMSCMPIIEELLRNPQLKSYADSNIGSIRLLKELEVNVDILLLSTLNSRYQQLPLQLADATKKFDDHDEEFQASKRAQSAIKALGKKINEQKKLADNSHVLRTIRNQLVWKPNLQQTNLNLNSTNRKFVCRGDLTRRGEMKITSWINHIILLDNYMIITERAKNPKQRGYCYKIIEDPIPIEFLIAEEKNTATPHSANSIPRPPLKTNVSSPSLVPNALLDVSDDEPNVFALKVRYAGRTKHTFTFSCRSEKERSEWIKYFSETKTALANRLKSSEPYEVKLVSNTCFAYDLANKVVKLPICPPGDPIYDVCQESLEKLNQLGYKSDLYNFSNSRNHLVYSKVQCMYGFEYKGHTYNIVGLMTGLYCCEAKGRWKKILNGTDFTKIHVDTTSGIVIVLADKYLRYYLLPQFLGVYAEKKSELTSIPVSKEPVLFFAVGHHKNMTMLFYAKKKNNGTTHFKVLAPESDGNGVFSRFKEERKFYIQAECYGVSIFNSSFAVHTNKGFEILDLDKLRPRTVPDLPFAETDTKKKVDQYARKSVTSASAGVDVIRKLVSGSGMKPLGMFKLNNNSEFLLAYNEFAIFINKHGKLSRFSILGFKFKAKAIQFVNNYLFIICDEVIEIWSISDFVKGTNKLMQVITGKDIRSICDEDIAISMANPKVPGLQLVFQLVSKANF